MAPTRSHSPLRLAFVHTPGAALPIWVAHLIERIADDPDLQLVAMHPGAPPEGTPRPAFSLTLFLEGLSEPAHYRGLSTARADAILAGLPRLGPESGPVDLALALTGTTLDPAQLAALGCEEWSLRIGDEPVAQAGPASMRALAEGAPLVPITLMTRRTGAEQAQPVFTAQYNIKPSAVALKVFLCEKAMILVQRALRCRACDRPVDAGVDMGPDDAPPPATLGRTYPAALARAVVKRATSRLRDRLGRPSDYWELRMGQGALGQPELTSLRPLPRFSRAMADPFLFNHDGTLYLFYEAFDSPDSEAWIDVCRLTDGRPEPLGTALRCPYHLSFPQVFAHDGEIYMMPETQQMNRLEIWRATRFPLEWERHAIALEGQLPADSCLFNRGNEWWLFSNLSDHYCFQEHSSALYLFRVDGPSLTSLTPHPLNPIVIGSDVARNAGAVFAAGDMILRPSQNNSYGVYGYGVNLMRVERLDDTDYHETLLCRITPRDLGDAQGVHHLSFAQGHFVLDAYLNRAAAIQQ